MTRMNHCLLAAGVAALLCLSTGDALAQGKQKPPKQSQNRNPKAGKKSFDPAQAEQRMFERYRERLEIKDDNEWKAIQPLLERVLTLRRALESHGRAGANRGPQSSPVQNPAGGTSSEGDVLHKAVDAKAPGAQLNTALARYLEWRQAKQADLQRAQADLRVVLTPRQEAIAVLADLL